MDPEKASRAAKGSRRSSGRSPRGRSRSGKPPAGTGEERFRTVLEQIGPEFVQEGARGIGPAELAALAARLDEVAAEFERGEALGRLRRDGLLLIEAIRDWHAGRYSRFSFWTVALIVFALLYVAKPIDIIPDALPVVGQLDDAVVVTHCLLLVRDELQAYRLWRLARELDEPSA